MALPDDTAPASFTWGSNGARMTPEQIAASRKVADALALQAGDGSPFPVGTRGAGLVTQGLARVAKGVSAGLDYREADAVDKANASDNAAMIASLLGGGQSAPVASAATPVAAVAGPAPAAAVAAPSTPKIYTNDEPSPLDPPSGADRVKMIATILGEENTPAGQAGVANVIRNRAVDGGYGGDTPSAVVTAPNQFEPWNTPEGRQRMAAAASDPKQVAAANAAIDGAYGTNGRAPEDPTEGKTMFYAPAAQAALGRPAPSWAQGPGQTLGHTAFYDEPEDASSAVAAVAKAAAGAPAPVQVASNDPTAGVAAAAAPSPAASPAVAKVAGAMNPAVMQALTSPYSSESTKKVAGLMLQQQLAQAGKEHFTQRTDADGNLLNVNSNGQVTVGVPAEKDPTSVKEFEYYKKNFQPTDQQPTPMAYQTWATKAARDAASEAPGQVKSLTPGGELYHMENGKVVVDHKNDKSVNAEDVSQSTIDYLADRTRMGDPSVKVGYARNPGMIAKIDATAREREDAGIPVSDAAKNVTNNRVTLSARGSAERKLGTINTNNEFYGNNALGALDIAEKASADVPRTDYPSVNKALNAYRTQTGDPKTVALGAALNTVVNDYAKFTGGGVGTDSLRGHAEEILNGAHSPDQLQAIVHMMRLEIKRGQQSPSMVREGFDSLYAPHGSAAEPAAAPVAAPAATAPPVAGAKQAPDGKFYVPDPSRPGKYLEVRP